MAERRAQSRMTRRRLMAAVRSALVGLCGVTFVAAARTSTQPLTGEATQRKQPHARQGHASHTGNKRQRKHQGQSKRNNGKTRRGDIQLSTGSVLPQSLVEAEGAQFSSHMLLPFESFPTEAKLGQAVAAAEKLNLFVLPKSVEVENH